MNEKEKELFNFIIEQTDNGKFQWTKEVYITELGITRYIYRYFDTPYKDFPKIIAEKIITPFGFPCYIRFTGIITLIPENFSEFARLEQAIKMSLNKKETEEIDKIIGKNV